MLSRFAPPPSPHRINGTAPPTLVNEAAPARPSRPREDAKPSMDMVELKVRLHQQLIDIMNLSAIEKMERDQFTREVGDLVRELLSRERTPLNHSEKARLTQDILDELLGLGPLEPLLKDPTIGDILVNTHKQVMIERKGRLEPCGVRFKDEAHLLRIINRIVAAVGRHVDESHPMVDARLADGSRVNAVVPPVAVDGALVSIRKFSRVPFSMGRLVEVGALTPQMSSLLETIVRARLSILISGGTGSGKTTLLNAMSGAIDHRERIVTIEDAAELQLQQPQVARLETRPVNIEGRGEVTPRDLVRNALRMRPDRIIVGEVRGGEAFDMLQAMNTGHEGSMSTIHANTCRDAMSRLEQMIGMAGIEMSLRSIRSQIASAIQLVIQLSRLSDGKRKITSIHEITGLEGDVITMQELFCFKREGLDDAGNVRGHYWATGIRPRFAEELETRGIRLPRDMFSPDRPLG
jgi:pilus assembly protein CpaF